MSKYIDGFVLPVPADQIEDYRKIAEMAGAVWKEHGALEYIEAAGDDLEVEHQKPFTKMVGAKQGETVVFAYIIFDSREHRDEVNAKVMEDPRIKEMCEEDKLGLNYKRMAYGGFRQIV